MSEAQTHTFDLIPAIDLLGGKCVRLTQGRYDAATTYDENPARVAAGFASHAVRWLHVVDLDGAREGRVCNRSAVEAILASAGSMRVELGGGIRSIQAIEDALEAGVHRVVLGTVAVREPELVADAARRFPGKIAVGLDARDGRVAVQGWLEQSDATAVELAKRFSQVGVAAIIYTDIDRDGMLTGPNLDATAELAESVPTPVIASGGVGSLDDIARAAKLRERGLAGVIVGRALYTGDVDLEQALEVVRCS